MDSENWIDAGESKPKSSTPMDTHWVWAVFRHTFPKDAPWEVGRCRWLGEHDVWRSEGSPSEVEVILWQELPTVPMIFEGRPVVQPLPGQGERAMEAVLTTLWAVAFETGMNAASGTMDHTPDQVAAAWKQDIRDSFIFSPGHRTKSREDLFLEIAAAFQEARKELIGKPSMPDGAMERFVASASRIAAEKLKALPAPMPYQDILAAINKIQKGELQRELEDRKVTFTHQVFREFEKDGWPGEEWLQERLIDPFVDALLKLIEGNADGIGTAMQQAEFDADLAKLVANFRTSPPGLRYRPRSLRDLLRVALWNIKEIATAVGSVKFDENQQEVVVYWPKDDPRAIARRFVDTLREVF